MALEYLTQIMQTIFSKDKRFEKRVKSLLALLENNDFYVSSEITPSPIFQAYLAQLGLTAPYLKSLERISDAAKRELLNLYNAHLSLSQRSIFEQLTKDIIYNALKTIKKPVLEIPELDKDYRFAKGLFSKEVPNTACEVITKRMLVPETNEYRLKTKTSYR